MLVSLLAACLPDHGRVAGRDDVGTDASDVGTPHSDMTPSGGCSLRISPTLVKLELVPVGTTATRTLTSFNTGSAPCIVAAVERTGHAGFSLASTQLPLTLEPLTSRSLDVTFTASDALPARGELMFRSNDPERLNGYRVDLRANAGSCMESRPSTLSFGERSVGTSSLIDVALTACGDDPLVVESVVIEGDDDFSAAIDGLPRSLPPGRTLHVPVTFVPDTPGDSTGELIITTDTLVGTTRLPIRGAASASCCGAGIVCDEGDEVLVGTTLHCRALMPECAASFMWDVVAWPDGAPEPFLLPSATSNEPQVVLDAVGTYTLTLTTSDALGQSCGASTQRIAVFAGPGLHVELEYVVPGEQDERGPIVSPILDLHLMHPDASGWFDDVYDANAFNNPTPSWGGPGDADDPQVTNQSVALALPGGGMRYAVGVHFRSLGSFVGRAAASVRIYRDDVLVFTSALELEERDLWEVAVVDWPDGVSTVAEWPRVIPDFVIPDD